MSAISAAQPTTVTFTQKILNCGSYLINVAKKVSECALSKLVTGARWISNPFKNFVNAHPIVAVGAAFSAAAIGAFLLRRSKKPAEPAATPPATQPVTPPVTLTETAETD